MEKIVFNKIYNEDNEISKSMVDAYLNCPPAIRYLDSIGINHDLAIKNIDKIYDFVCDLEYCTKCPGIKKCQKNNPLLCVKINNRNGNVERQLVPCKAYIKYAAFKKSFLIMDFEDDWLEADLRKIDKTAPRIQAVTVMKNYMQGKSNDWLYIIGGPGTGRSYLAANIATYLAKNDMGPICFINASKRFKELLDNNYRDPSKYEKLLNTYTSVPILVIDDFGNEVKNDFVRDGILFQILNIRASKRLFTIFTSDFSISEVVDLYSTSKAATPRANQIGKIIKNAVKEEINLGDISIY